MSNSIDHRQIADEMEIYVINESVGAGLPLWLPNGVAIRDALEAYVKELERREGYQRVVSPHLGKEELYQKSGHLRFYAEDMYPPLALADGPSYYLKPMNCPHHHMAYKASPRSYRQLPLRLAEYGQVYRNERSGALRGLSRVRGLCQNDAHIYVAPEQALAEIRSVLRLHERCYRDLGIRDHRYRLSMHDPARPDEFDGDQSLWLKCEGLLREALEAENLPYFESNGEAAFYGPKIDVQMSFDGQKDESVASVQLDFLSADRFDLSYIDASSRRQRPWVVHRAPLGSHERFIALLLERYQGRLPGWLAPLQCLVIPVSEQESALAQELAQDLIRSGLRAQVDFSLGSLSKRIAAAHRVRPFAMIVVGQREQGSGRVQIQLAGQVLEAEVSEVRSVLRPLLRAPHEDGS